MEELVSLLRVYRRKKDLRDPKMPLQEGKRNEKSALAGLGGRKSRARPEKAEKRPPDGVTIRGPFARFRARKTGDAGA